jgi:competence/damage-inducible protein CinA-like protein
MRAEVISIGDELTSGQRLDTNSQWLSLRLGELGVPVVCHVTVADDLETNVEVFRQAVDRADIVISTGGLGPTADDLTREVLARLSGTELVLDEPSLEHIRGLFARRRRPMPERNVVQAMFPRGSRPIANPEGTAPGIALDVPAKGHTAHVFALPGVPAEMRQMWEESLVPALRALGAGTQVLRHRTIKCFGVGESDLEQMLPDLIRRGRTPQVGITVHEATISLRITAAAENAEACFAQMEPTVATIRDCLGTLVFGEGDDELENAVLTLLANRGQTLATCEGGTAGLLAQWLGATPDSGGVFRGGLVINSDQVLASMLDGSAPPTSADAARAMAQACRGQFGADYGLAITPFPATSLQADAPPQMHLALATAEGVTVTPAPLAAHSAIVKPLAAKRALNLLRLTLLEKAAN